MQATLIKTLNSMQELKQLEHLGNLEQLDSLEYLKPNQFAVCATKEIAEKHMGENVTLHRMREVK